MVLALVFLAGCDRSPPPPPPVQPATEDKSSVELKIDTGNGAVEFKKEEKSE
jgi:hypothetical protein